MLQAQAEYVSPDPPDEFCETLVLHGPAMFIEAGEEVAARREALVGVLRVAVEVGLPEGCMAEVKEIVLRECFDAFRGGLTGETPARVAHTGDAEARRGSHAGESQAACVSSEKSAWLKEHFELFCETGMVHPNP